MYFNKCTIVNTCVLSFNGYILFVWELLSCDAFYQTDVSEVSIGFYNVPTIDWNDD